MPFKDIIKGLRTENNLSQLQLAKNLNLERYIVSNWEQGRNEPSIEDLIMLSKYFGVTIDYLAGLETIGDFNRRNDFQHQENRQPLRLPTNDLNLTDEETEMIKRYRILHPEMQKFFYDSILRLTKPRTLDNI
ncbi:XRE family transcriptional regulator [Candidatus Borkfalkia ceftriaxoniphila]|mgnify:FL=1|uniref:XRE family transcriptional regulator n=1 Tax=Candidatus Borkfalkia ceftriaxoniphila TaxID=2508949 RepID=A0A4Q2K5B5_9FIRM|nr:helix-turn-helix transcriptional regulator [Candidatus Borkfalkia ceftriaxoniphila]RXZ58122.1 XRE family transcriptional regulator [Candidatus Borkfalkia ceftriaxoniphila]